jgi:hypothetical protein
LAYAHRTLPFTFLYRTGARPGACRPCNPASRGLAPPGVSSELAAAAQTLLARREQPPADLTSWVARDETTGGLVAFAAETKGVQLAQAHLALAALSAIRPGDATGAQALGDLCSGLGRDDLAQVVDEWLERRPR